LDEPENADVIEMLDYVDSGNRIRTDYILNWMTRYNDPSQRMNLNLNRLLYEVFQLYTKAPPIPFEEIFGEAESPAHIPPPMPSNDDNGGWEELPAHLQQ